MFIHKAGSSQQYSGRNTMQQVRYPISTSIAHLFSREIKIVGGVLNRVCRCTRHEKKASVRWSSYTTVGIATKGYIDQLKRLPQYTIVLAHRQWPKQRPSFPEKPSPQNSRSTDQLLSSKTKPSTVSKTIMHMRSTWYLGTEMAVSNPAPLWPQIHCGLNRPDCAGYFVDKDLAVFSQHLQKCAFIA